MWFLILVMVVGAALLVYFAVVKRRFDKTR
jgi:hypothetical protein